MADRQRSSPLYSSLKIFSWIVVLLMIAAILYAAGLSLAYWDHIRV